MAEYKSTVLKVHPIAQCMHVPMSMGFAIYVGEKMIGNAASDQEHAWASAARMLNPCSAMPFGCNPLGRCKMPRCPDMAEPE